MAIDFTRPFVDRSQLDQYFALDVDTTREYGKTVRAVEMSNVDYSIRHRKLAENQAMKPPPSHNRIFAGYLVVRKPGTKGEYETWMPDHMFDDLYMATPRLPKRTENNMNKSCLDASKKQMTESKKLQEQSLKKLTEIKSKGGNP